MGVAAFIASSQRTEHAVPHAVTCRARGLNQSGFCTWRDRQPTARQTEPGDVRDLMPDDPYLVVRGVSG
ncbi:hypothetical protein GA0074694_4050 [Micromonospora inyonensis]|uniref:Uncharacterized protein n=1 Tax=Micromonospora inyonensis TaxID=47866 RepID=A0A1C6S621_9ACTN|nr:hypothetical protein GA0074694_4050 [Micromonospora inyonensis]